METVKIPDTTYVRDIHSKALLNTDKRALHEYLMKKEIAKKQNEKTEQFNERLTNLENDIATIKNILIGLSTRL